MNKYYSLCKNYLVRWDKSYGNEAFVFNVDNGQHDVISISMYLFIKLIEEFSPTKEEILTFSEEHELKFSLADIEHSLNLLTENIIIFSSAFRNTRKSIHIIDNKKFPVPVCKSPREIEVHLSDGCNISCKHCFMSAQGRSKNELDLSVWSNLLEQAESLSVKKIILTGGEPLFYKQFDGFIDLAKNKKIRFDVLTNGMLITKNRARILASNNFSTCISIDGHNEFSHDSIRGRGAYSKTIKGVKLLREFRASYSFSVTLHAHNIIHIEDIIKLCIDLGARQVSFLDVDDLGRASINKDIFPSSKLKTDAKNFIQSMVKKYSGKLNILHFDPSVIGDNSLTISKQLNDPVACSATTTRIAIKSDGKVFPCVYAFSENEYSAGSIEESDLLSLWQSDKFDIFRGGIKLSQLKDCLGCSSSDSCIMKNCRLRGYSVHRDIYGKPKGCQQPA